MCCSGEPLFLCWVLVGVPLIFKPYPVRCDLHTAHTSRIVGSLHCVVCVDGGGYGIHLQFGARQRTAGVSSFVCSCVSRLLELTSRPFSSHAHAHSHTRQA